MGRAYLRAQAAVTLDGEPYVFDRQCSDGIWVLQHEKTGRSLEKSTSDIYDAYVAGTLSFRTKEVRSIALHVRRAPVSLAAASVVRPAAALRLAFVREAKDLPHSRVAIEEAIERVLATLEPRPPKKPHWVTVYRWARAYAASDNNPLALTDDHASKGNRLPRFSPDVIDICRDVIDDVYLTLERPPVQHATDIAIARTRKANTLRPAGEALEMPSRRLLQRLIDDIPAYDKHAARYGREAARKKFRSVSMHRLTDGPLERAEMDHTRMDIFAVDDEYGLPLGRPWLTVLVDDYTRCVLGICLSFEPPSRATVARCLRHAFMPKANLREQYPDLKNGWAMFGIVSELALDGGTEFHSAELEQICFELNTEQHFCGRKTPWHKGKVERFQGTLNRGTSAEAPGKTFEGIVDRDDYDPTKHAVMSIFALKHVVVRWIVDVYHQRKHAALGCSPAQMWASSVQPHDIAMLADPLRFDAIVGGSEQRVLTHKGIEYAGLLYNSPDLAELRRTLGDKLDVVVRVDRSNLGSVIVLHPERGTPYRVPCLRSDYAEGLTEWQHGVCKRYARERLKGDGDPDAWLDALLEISEIVEREMQLGKRRGTTRERMARWSQSRPAATAPAVQPLPAATPSLVAPPPLLTGAATPTRKRFEPVVEERSLVPSDVGGVQ